MSTFEQPSPLQNFSGCHEGILKHIKQLESLASFIEQGVETISLKALAAELEQFYQKVIISHHQEEEQELFTAVKTALHPDPADLAEANHQIERLTQEHRQIEAWWREIEPALKRLAKGKTAQLEHALFEEAVFLPLSARLLDKNGLSALGLSLHIRHQDAFVAGYI